MASRYSLLLLVIVAVGLLQPACGAQPERSTEATATDKGQSTAKREIRAGSEAFAAAFDRGDATALAAYWAPDGEYIDEQGQRYVGPKAIEQEYAAFFAAHPGETLRIAIDSVHLISDTVVIEDGHTSLDPVPVGAPARSRYTAVHVKIDGKWLLASVRDIRVPSNSTYGHLQQLEWMIGSWSAIPQGNLDAGHAANITCKWGPQKGLIEVTYHIDLRRGDEPAAGRQIIAWDPMARRVQSWSFAADGGRSTGVWTERNGAWYIVSTGILPNGTKATSVSSFTRLGDSAMAWQSSKRVADGIALPDATEIVLQRVASAP